MPRQSRGPAPAPRRPTAPAAPPRPAPQQQQTRPASTAAAPPQQQHAPPPQQQAAGSQGPGLFGQMASTAAGVAVGSSIGHAIGGFFGGGSSSAPAESAAPQAPAEQQSYANTQSQQMPSVCANQVQDFRKCMDENSGSLTICGWYLDQLKACQAAASQY